MPCKLTQRFWSSIHIWTFGDFPETLQIHSNSNRIFPFKILSKCWHGFHRNQRLLLKGHRIFQEIRSTNRILKNCTGACFSGASVSFPVVAILTKKAIWCNLENCRNPTKDQTWPKSECDIGLIRWKVRPRGGGCHSRAAPLRIRREMHHAGPCDGTGPKFFNQDGESTNLRTNAAEEFFGFFFEETSA